MRANIVNVTAEELNKEILEQGKLFEKGTFVDFQLNLSKESAMEALRRFLHSVRDPGLATMDARLIMTQTDTAMNLARKMKIEGNAFDVDEFLIRSVID